MDGKVSYKGHVVRYRVFWDDRSDPSRPGWYAVYEHKTDEGWDVLGDSEKVWHPDMPKTRRGAKAAERIAERTARKFGRGLASTLGY